MPTVEFQKLTVVTVLLITAAVATVTVLGTVQSDALLGAAILGAVAVIAFQAGVQYRDLREA